MSIKRDLGRARYAAAQGARVAWYMGQYMLARRISGPFNRPGEPKFQPQSEEGVTYAAKIEKAEARLNFRQSAQEVERQIRAFNPNPGAYFEIGRERVRILAAEVVPGGGRPGMVADNNLKIACAERAIQPTLVQRAGRAPMATIEFLRGFPIKAGTWLG